MSLSSQPTPPSPRSTDPGVSGRGRRTAAVVIGLDGSDTSWNAFYWGCGEAKRLGGRAVAVYVSPPAVPGGGPAWIFAAMLGFAICDPAADDQVAAEKAARLWAEVKARAADLDTELAFIHARGDAMCALRMVAEELDADVIAVGRSMKARHHIAGALGRRLMTKSDAPIIAVVP